MSSIWKVGIYRKISPTEAQCLACTTTPPKMVPMTDGNTTGLLNHTRTHGEYARKIQDLEDKKRAEKNALDKFLKILPKGMVVCAPQSQASKPTEGLEELKMNAQTYLRDEAEQHSWQIMHLRTLFASFQ